jgi:hypothetical protein
MEMSRLVSREAGRALIADATVLAPIPSVLVLLFPWLDNQAIAYKQR